VNNDYVELFGEKMLFFNLGKDESNPVTPRAVISKTITKQLTKQGTFERNLYVWAVYSDHSFDFDAVICSPLGHKTLVEVVDDLKMFNNILRFTSSGQAIFKPTLKQPVGVMKCCDCKFVNKNPFCCAINPTGIYLDYCNDREV
jgi:hypothetical protein